MSRVDWRGVTLDARTRDMMVEVDRLVGSTVPIHPSQGSYSNGALSAGTHSGGGAIDISVHGLSEPQILAIVRAMRTVGFAAWWRRSPEWSGAQHIHGIAVGCKDLNPIAAQQVVALRGGYNGLGHLGEGGRDRHASMNLPVTSWERYVAKRDAKPAVVKPTTYVVTLGKNCKPNRLDKTTFDLQRALIAGGYAGFKRATGFYGAGTQAAVRAFYKKHPQFQSDNKDVAIGAKGWAYLRATV